MTRSPLALASVGLASVLIGVLAVVIDEFSLAPWQKALVLGSMVPASAGVVWVVGLFPRTRTVGRMLAAAVALRSVESAFAYANPARYPERVVGHDGTAALVVPADSRMLMDVQLGVYNADKDKVGVVEVRQIERSQAVCLVVSRDTEEFWLGLEERMARDDSVPLGLHVRLEDPEMARVSAIEVLREWRAQ